MKDRVSFRTTLKISRYLFRALALLLWLLITLISVFYVVNMLHLKEAEIYRQLNQSAGQAQRYIQRSADIIKELKYIAENRLMAQEGGRVTDSPSVPKFREQFPDVGCALMEKSWRGSLQSLAWFINNVFVSYDLSRVFLLGSDNLCVTSFALNAMPVAGDQTLKMLRERAARWHNTLQDQRGSYLFWVRPGRPGSGYVYALTPLYLANHPPVLLGIEQSIRMENFFTPESLPVGVDILDENGRSLISLTGSGNKVNIDARRMQARSWFGYSDDFRFLTLKKSLAPSSLSIVYSVPVELALEPVRSLILKVMLLNALTAILLFTLGRIYQRRIFIPAQSDARQLEEHEQFNRKIIASAPVGICILRTQDGANILSNELAHNYLNLLTHEDRQRLRQIICGRQLDFVDVLTCNNTHLQISFVHSRYRDEHVAICVLVDVSARVQMERSLQEIAQAAEQASQSKSMFLATVSHELRTPLYGIIGNLDLLRSKALPPGIDRLATAMNNSSSLLLKIISDILDFSKIESEQLKTESREYSPREVMNHITANYLPLMVRKQLRFYCFIEPDVPVSLHGDPMRLQQVISNLLSNAIKFTDMGCIILHLRRDADYLSICVRDTGVGIPANEVMRLFEPFFQAQSGARYNFQGTGLGLAICEKLISMMDGDIAVDSEPGIGSRFTIRIPLYGARNPPALAASGLSGKCCWMAVRNASLAQFIESLLIPHGITVCCHAGEQPNPQDVLIADDELARPWPGLAAIIFCHRHIGTPLERVSGEWRHSTAATHELLTLLARIYGIKTQSTPQSEVRPAPEAPVASNDDMLILVVDDHPINRRLLADQLAALGYRCKAVSSGADALSLLSKQHIDIVLSDVNMPDMDGYRLTRCIRQRGLTLPVIGVTANALAQEQQRCLQSGMDGCLSKPVTLDMLNQTLAEYVARARKEALLL